MVSSTSRGPMRFSSVILGPSARAAGASETNRAIAKIAAPRHVARVLTLPGLPASPNTSTARAYRARSARRWRRFTSSRVREDRLDDVFPVGPIETVSGVVETQEPGVRDLVRERFPVADREHRIGRPVDHECGRGDRGERLVRSLLLVHELVIAGGREVTRALDLPAGEIAERR